MTQNNTYDINSCIPRLKYLLSCTSNETKKETQKEQALRKVLSKTNKQTIIGISIHNRLSAGSLGSFREMIKELKHQINDCGRERMIEVLGIDAVKLLETM